jgi:hypothetical protein
MSSAELQSLMSQLQQQRQDPYSQSNLHPDHFDRNWTYPDGTPGTDGIEPAAADKPARELRISHWEDGVVMDKKRDKKFQYFKDAVRGIDGSINYDDPACGNVENMAKIIAWEVFHRDKADRKLEILQKKLDHEKTKIATQVTKHPIKNDASHTELVSKLLDYMTGRTSKLPATPKNKKTPKARKPNPSVPEQREIWRKAQEKRRKAVEGKDKIFTPTDFVERTPGTFGKG